MRAFCEGRPPLETSATAAVPWPPAPRSCVSNKEAARDAADLAIGTRGTAMKILAAKMWLLGFMLLAGCRAGPAPRSDSAFAFVPHACAPALANAKARCGHVRVPENHDAPSARQIDLDVIVFDALKPTGNDSAQFDLEGGPGFAVTDSAAFYATDGVGYRTDRAVVLADMRGTGGSNALRCPAIEQRAEAEPLSLLYPPDLVRACAATLAASADLRQYTTTQAARDLDAVRAALGYRRVDLNAVSYGTTLALRYMATYPHRVRSAVLTGTVPAARRPPRDHARAATQGLEQVLAACRHDTACAARYPSPREDLDRALARLPADQRHPFLEKLRTMLYLPATARHVPARLHDAVAGDIDAFTKAGSGRVFADGTYLSITCAESFADMDIDRAIADADATPFGAYRLQRQRDACAEWPIAAVDKRFHEAVTSDVPTLFVSGAMDPVSPAAWAREVVAGFPNARQIVVPQGAHVMEGLSGLDTCLDAVTLAFVAKASAAGIDDTCVAAMDRGGFEMR